MLRPDADSNSCGEALARPHRRQTAPAVLVYAKKAAVPDAILALALLLLFRPATWPAMVRVNPMLRVIQPGHAGEK